MNFVNYALVCKTPFRGHSIITLSPNDRKVGSSPLFVLVIFWYSPSLKRSKLYINPLTPSPTPTTLHKVEFLTLCFYSIAAYCNKLR